MRLICPNCGAQYEIDASLLPKAGRDVQCSACGHTWFQRPETAEDEVLDELGAAVSEAPTTVAPDVRSDARPEPQPDAAAAPEEHPTSYRHRIEDLEEPDADDEIEAQAATPVRAVRPRRPDDAALAILREEAEREAEARRREAAGMETQGDLGLDDAPPPRPARPTPAVQDEAAIPDDEADADTGGAAPERPERPPRATGSAVFPDIDEINSSLTASQSMADAAGPDPEVEQARARAARRGFRLAFLTVVIFASVLIVLYAYAPRLAEAFPAARPYLADYVDWANEGRNQLDGLMQGAIALMGGSES